MVQRLHPHPYLALFNGPDTSMTTAVRDGSSVPLQALFLLNSPFVHDQSGRFARSCSNGEPDPPRQAPAGLPAGVLRGRRRTTELDRALAFLAQYERCLADEGVAADRRRVESWSGLARALAGVERIPLRGLNARRRTSTDGRRSPATAETS